MKHCTAVKKDGQRCTVKAGPDGFCTFGKARAEARKRGGERRGQGMGRS